jgi:hypothetical protein
LEPFAFSQEEYDSEENLRLELSGTLDPVSDKERRREADLENIFLRDSEAVEKSGDRGLPPAVKLCRMSGGGGGGASSKFTIFCRKNSTSSHSLGSERFAYCFRRKIWFLILKSKVVVPFSCIVYCLLLMLTNRTMSRKWRATYSLISWLKIVRATQHRANLKS